MERKAEGFENPEEFDKKKREASEGIKKDFEESDSCLMITTNHKTRQHSLVFTGAGVDLIKGLGMALKKSPEFRQILKYATEFYKFMENGKIDGKRDLSNLPDCENCHAKDVCDIKDLFSELKVITKDGESPSMEQLVNILGRTMTKRGEC